MAGAIDDGFVERDSGKTWDEGFPSSTGGGFWESWVSSAACFSSCFRKIVCKRRQFCSSSVFPGETTEGGSGELSLAEVTLGV